MNFQSKKTMPRYFIVTAVLFLAAVCAVGKAIYTMTVDREYWVGMSKLLVREGRTLPAKRGNILAADGSILAASLPEYQIYLDFKTWNEKPELREKDYKAWQKDSIQRAEDQARRDSLFTTKVDSLVDGLHAIFPDIIPEKLRAHLQKGFEARSHYWPVYVNDVTTLTLKKNENRRISYVDYSEVRKLPILNVKSTANFVKTDLRRRPYGELAQRTIGSFRDSARYGLELTFDSVLAGRPGTFHYQKVMNRRVPVIDKPAEDGCDIVTTIDVEMQQLCEEALGDKLKEIDAVSGVCILMETATGDIKAMTSLSRHEDGTYHEDRALAVTDLYEPGSVFKPQSFLVGFDDGLLKMTDCVDVAGGIYNFGNAKMKDHNWRSGGYGLLTVPEIIGFSSNVGVSVLINRYYHDNPSKYVDGLYRIGSAEDLKIPLDGYMKPRIRRPGQGAYWSATTLPWMSIGYEVQVTPINTLTFYNGIANNGRMVRPRLVKAIMRGGEVVEEKPIEVLREQMAKPEAVSNVQECLKYVVSKGVGKRAGSKNFSVAGKTGTAQIWTGQGRTSEYFVTFAGYFPADRPLYSCIVCIRKPAPASGGGHCGPVFKRVAEAVMAGNSKADFTSAADSLHAAHPVKTKGNIAAIKRIVRPYTASIEKETAAGDETAWGEIDITAASLTATPETAEEGAVPDVIGYGLRDAVTRLESLGLRVKVKGTGRVVLQSLAAGHKTKKGEVITLTLEEKKSVAKHTAEAAPAAPKDAVTNDSAAAKKPAATEEKKDKEQKNKEKPKKEKPKEKATKEKDKKKKS